MKKTIALLGTIALALFASPSKEADIIFFLDIDGVLNSFDSGTMFPNNPDDYSLNIENVSCFTNMISLYPSSKVVLHTGWNKRAFDAKWTFGGNQYQSLVPQVTNILGKYYYGITKYIPTVEGGCKAKEILKWIDSNSKTNGFFVVIDDDTGPMSSFTKGAFPLFDLPSMNSNIFVRPINKRKGFLQTDFIAITNQIQLHFTE